LREPVFTHHGQLYVAANRVPSFNGLRFYIFEYNGQGHLANDERAFTKNIICTEVLNHEINFQTILSSMDNIYCFNFIVSIKNI
jgi:transcriptional regulator of heat shock response